MKEGRRNIECLLVAFLVGFTVMSLEILAPRILAPHFGSSIEVWTSVIGITLLCLAAGSLVGGMLADGVSCFTWLRRCLAAASVLLAAIALTYAFLMPFIALHSKASSVGAFISFAILFGPSLVVLGSTSPLLYRISTLDVAGAGRAAARLGALSAIGSLMGTFGTGYILLYLMKTQTLLSMQAVICLGAVVVLDLTSFKLPLLIAPLVLVSMAFQPRTPYLEVETPYSKYQIIDTRDPSSGRPIRALRNGPCGVQSAAFLDTVRYQDRFFELEQRLLAGENRHPLEVLSFFDAYRYFIGSKETLSVLILGAGAFQYPMRFLEKNPAAEIDVVDIDPALEAIAARYFGFVKDKRLTVYAEDARTFINRSKKTYDLIFVDVFTSACAIPAHIITRQSVLSMRRLLSPGGIVITNAIGSIAGRGHRGIASLVATFGAVFPAISVAAVESPGEPERVQNFAIVAAGVSDLKGAPSDAEYERFRQHLVPNSAWEAVPVLDDGYAPLDLYLTSG